MSDSYREYFEVFFFSGVARDAMKQRERRERRFIAARTIAGNELFGNR